MKEINFSAPNYGSFSQRIKQDLDRIGRGVEQFARGAGGIYDSYQDELENKRKWDNMIAQQKYQRERDAIADERYNVEQRRIEEELRRQQDERQARYNAMMANKEFMRQRYGVGDYDAQDRELDGIDRSMDDIENGSYIDDTASIQYGREVNGARTRARNLVASPYDYDVMRATPSDFVGNGRFAQPSPNGNPYANLEKYGEGAVMAAAMMENASNPEDYNAAYNYLMSVISQYNQAEQGRQEIERDRAIARADDQLSSNIMLHPVMSEVSRIAAGSPLKNYSAQDVGNMISTLQELERQAMTIGDNAKRMEVVAKINNAYGKLGESQEIERDRAIARADDQLSSNIVLHPVMSEVSRIAAGTPLKNYTAQDVNGMISTLQELERQAMTIGDNSKRMEVMSKINNAYGKLEEIYGRKTAPGARRK